jgi:hypothetical protein
LDRLPEGIHHIRIAVQTEEIVLGKPIQYVQEIIIKFIGQAGLADSGDFLDLSTKRLGPLFDISVVLIEDECWSKYEL